MRVLSVLVFVLVATAAAAADFDDLFVDATLRIDYFHTGDATHEYVSVDQLWRQGIYAGSRTRLLDDLDLGRYYAKLYDAGSGELLWSRGFDSYFGEWQTTTPAANGVLRTYHESALAPYPKVPVEFALEARDAHGVLQEVFRTAIDPDDPMIRRDPPPAGIVVVEAAKGGDPHGCVDVAILGEGYTADQVDEFEQDVRHFAQVMLDHEPYKSHVEHFNIYGVLLPSQDEGCDEPSRGIHKRTSLGCTFDSLGSERYMLTEDNRALRDVAQVVPYDALYVLVNHERYGGGGIYNSFNTFTSDNQWSDYVFLHEFGHHFAGLADEYYSSSTAYNDFYPRGVEPGERNITRMLDGRPKWADIVNDGVAIPTPWTKSEYDAMDGAYQQKRAAINERIAALMRSGAAEDEIAAAKAEGEELSLANQQKIDAWFADNDARGQVGAFEGAGYATEGIFRSQLDCIMFTKGVKPFCAACRRGIVEVIGRYLE
ncbi:MAG: peptidase M64 [bacterium]|nr:peptidase M64 [bacterium]